MALDHATAECAPAAAGDAAAPGGALALTDRRTLALEPLGGGANGAARALAHVTDAGVRVSPAALPLSLPLSLSRRAREPSPRVARALSAQVRVVSADGRALLADEPLGGDAPARAAAARSDDDGSAWVAVARGARRARARAARARRGRRRGERARRARRGAQLAGPAAAVAVWCEGSAGGRRSPRDAGGRARRGRVRARGRGPRRRAPARRAAHPRRRARRRAPAAARRARAPRLAPAAGAPEAIAPARQQPGSAASGRRRRAAARRGRRPHVADDGADATT